MKQFIACVHPNQQIPKFPKPYVWIVVILLQLPGHTTHRLLPADVLFDPLESYYEQAVEKWLTP